MTVEFFKNQGKAWDNMDEYGYTKDEALLLKVRWNESLDNAGGRPMDIDYSKVKKGDVGFISGVKRKDYKYTSKEAKLDGFDVISELKYPKSRNPIFHKGVEVEAVGVYDLKKKLIRPATPITVRVTGSSNMLGRVRGVVTSGDHKGKSVHISTLSSRVIGCPKNERLVRGRCIRR